MAALRRNPNAELESMKMGYEAMIREAMARRIWIEALAEYVESDLSEDDPTVERLKRMKSGADWYDIAPETPKAADAAADDLAELYNVGGSKTPMADLFEALLTFDGHFDGFVGGDTAADRHDNDRAIALTQEFGAGMVEAANESGTSWFDDHKEPPDFIDVTFTCDYDGNDLTWSGSLNGRAQRTGKGSSFMGAGLRGRIAVVNAGDKDSFNHSYVIAFGVGILSFPMLLLVYARNSDDAIELCTEYLADHAPGLLDDDGELDGQSWYLVEVDPDHDRIVELGSSQGHVPRIRHAVPTIEVFDNRDQIVDTWTPADFNDNIVGPAAQFIIDHGPVTPDSRTFAPGTFYMAMFDGVHGPGNRIFRLRNFSVQAERAIFDQIVPAMARARVARARAPARRPRGGRR